MLLSSNRVGASEGLTVKRQVSGKKQSATILEPRENTNYVVAMNCVDWNDCDSADYSTTIWTSGYYLRIFCWGLDRVVHAVYIIVCFLAMAGVGKAEWKNYEIRTTDNITSRLILELSS